MIPLSLASLARIPRLKPLVMASPCHLQITKNYSKDGHGMSEKARSTAEEFTRQAKEKAESVSQGAKEAWDDLKEAASEEKEKFKETVEKGITPSPTSDEGCEHH